MKKLEQALFELEDIINAKIKYYKIPATKGSSIRISHFVIRPSKKHGYLVIDTETNKTLTSTFSKIGAVAVAKAKLDNKTINDIIHYDSVLEKNYNDLFFYNHILETTEDEQRQETIKCRLEISSEKIENAKRVLDNIIFSDFR
jgi:hypothetical protein